MHNDNSINFYNKLSKKFYTFFGGINSNMKLLESLLISALCNFYFIFHNFPFFHHKWLDNDDNNNNTLNQLIEGDPEA